MRMNVECYNSNEVSAMKKLNTNYFIITTQAGTEQQYQTKQCKATRTKPLFGPFKRQKLNKFTYSKSVQMEKVHHCKLRYFDTKKSLIDI